MNKIALIGLLTLCGSSVFAMGPLRDFEALLNAALATGNEKGFSDAVKEHNAREALKIDIDTATLSTGQTYLEAINIKGDPVAAKIFAELAAHRSNPDNVDELRRFIRSAMLNEKDIPALETFLEGKTFNIDLIPFQIHQPGVTIGDQLAGVMDRDLARKIRNLPRIKSFRYVDTSKDDLVDLFIDTIDRDPAHFETFEKLYTDMATRKLSVEVDGIYLIGGRRTMGGYLSTALTKNPANEGALRIAERVQKDRTDKTATLGALFKAFKKNAAHVEVLTEWFKKFPVDVDEVDYVSAKAKVPVKLGAKLNKLVTSTTAAMQKAAISVERIVRTHRAADMKVFNDHLEAYKKDATKLSALKECYEKKPFDIDRAPVDLAKPEGEKLGESIDALKDDALTALFKDTRSKVPAGASWLTPRNIFIAAVVGVLAVTTYCLWKNQQNKQDSREELPAIK